MGLRATRHPRSVRRALTRRLKTGSGYSAGLQRPVVTSRSRPCPDAGHGRCEDSRSRTQHHAMFLLPAQNPPASEVLLHFFSRHPNGEWDEEQPAPAEGPATIEEHGREADLLQARAESARHGTTLRSAGRRRAPGRHCALCGAAACTRPALPGSLTPAGLSGAPPPALDAVYYLPRISRRLIWGVAATSAGVSPRRFRTPGEAPPASRSLTAAAPLCSRAAACSAV